MQTVALFAEPDRLSSVAEWMTFRDRFCSPFLNVKGLHTAAGVTVLEQKQICRENCLACFLVARQNVLDFS